MFSGNIYSLIFQPNWSVTVSLGFVNDNLSMAELAHASIDVEECHGIKRIAEGAFPKQIITKTPTHCH
jgi:hypothetical protein